MSSHIQVVSFFLATGLIVFVYNQTNLNNYTLSILSSKVNVASGLLLIVPGLPGPTNVEKRDKYTDSKITLDARLHVFTVDSTN